MAETENQGTGYGPDSQEAEYDLVDALIDALNDGVPGVTFERDVLETNRPDDWAAVELTGEGSGDWGDGTKIDQTLDIDVWVCVSHRGSRIKRRVQAVLKTFCAAHEAGWELKSRNYVYDLDKVIWRWTVNVWAPLEDETGEEDDGETEETVEPEDETGEEDDGETEETGETVNPEESLFPEETDPEETDPGETDPEEAE